MNIEEIIIIIYLEKKRYLFVWVHVCSSEIQYKFKKILFTAVILVLVKGRIPSKVHCLSFLLCIFCVTNMNNICTHEYDCYNLELTLLDIKQVN